MQVAPRIDWNEITEHATELLRGYLRIDTTNPPGGEEAGAVYLRNALAREGIEAKLYDAGDARVSIAARIPAATHHGKKPLVLLSHIDVVPVEPEHWQHAPFGGELVDEVIWGRGALDMKGMAVMELLSAALLVRHRLPLERDVVFLAVADEEEGGRRGVHWLAEHHPELLEADYVLNEGAYGLSEFMGRQTRMIGIGPSEKSPCWVRLRARGLPGHASIPHPQNAVVKLVRALARIEAYEHRLVLSPAVEAMLRTLAQRGFLPADLDVRDPATLAVLASVDGHLHAVTHDTASLTTLRAGHKLNVIPAQAEATVDCRLLPTTDPEGFLAELRRIVDDPEIEIEKIYGHSAGASSMDTPLVKIAGDVVREKLGDEAFLFPQLAPGFTDSHAFRATGAAAYGFTPALLTREELATIHGHNERLSVANLRLGTEVLFEVVRRVACEI